ncbi:MAG: secretin N-terminal domain-containing protein, partial [Steroidobacteraceae bacterium]
MSRKIVIGTLTLLLACAVTGRAHADTLTDPTRPPKAGAHARDTGGLHLEGVLCHAGVFTGIANDRLVHVGDRIDGAVIRGISAAGMHYSRGAHEGFAYAPEPQLDGCSAAAAAAADGGPVFGVDVDGAPASVFLEGLVEGTPYNILVRPDVAGRVTMSLKNVTLQQILESVREMYGFDYRHTGAGYLILPATVQTRIFHISYLDLQRYGVSNTRISSGQVTQGDYNSQYGNTTSSPTQTPATTTVGNASDKTTIDTSGTSVITRDDSDFWGSLEANLHEMVGNEPGHRVIVDRQSGIIVVRALPEQLQEV